MFNNSTGWWYTYPSEKYDFVSWDDDIPMESHKSSGSKPPIRIYIEIMTIIYSEFSIENGGSFHRFLYIYQALT